MGIDIYKMKKRTHQTSQKFPAQRAIDGQTRKSDVIVAAVESEAAKKSNFGFAHILGPNSGRFKLGG